MMTKLEEFQKRNKKRNAHLYNEGTIIGIDYIVCPASGERLSLIKTNYITNVLGMTVAHYDELYPGVRQVVSKSRVANISNGLKVIDSVTGKTKYELSQESAKQTLSKMGSDGLTGYERKGQNTRLTHMMAIDENGRNGFERLVFNRKNTFLEDGLSVEQHSHIKRNARRVDGDYSRKKTASKASKRSFQPIVQLLNDTGIKYYFDEHEYGIRDSSTNKHYFFDLVIPDYKMAIEFQGRVWHANPAWTDDKWNSWRRIKGERINAIQSIDYDYSKAKALYKERGYHTYHVWEDTDQDDVAILVSHINRLMENNNERRQ
jgi:G:T-mismatch repair DNA endonuclease (very short patch repair protein)